VTKEIYAMARKSVSSKMVNPELYDMVHTENFVLVDAKKRVRFFYDGTKKEEIACPSRISILTTNN
jgi:protein SCO1/2